ncbi:MAG: hypothetical protein GVY35_10220 [Bacteroidetes bacterium]|nr:hypothetical protein [Bacteroidota bacterium]
MMNTNSQLVAMIPEPTSEVAAAIRDAAPTAPVVVDFDETLWLLNSTETFLQAARPRWLAVLLLLLVDALRPWAWMGRKGGYETYRDWIRVRLITALMPWTLPRWRRRARVWGPRHANGRLLTLLAQSAAGRWGVATLGFREVVQPLLEAAAPEAKLWTSAHLGWNGWSIRRNGKLASLERDLGARALAAAVVITDSERDLEVERGGARAVVVHWPNARFRPAHRGFYLPLRYTEQGKRAGQGYVKREILKVDVGLAVLVTAFAAADPLPTGLAAALLQLSFWCVYELGYWENDVLGRRLEARPTLGRRARVMARTVRPALAWVAAAALGGGAIGVYALGGSPGGATIGTAAAAGIAWSSYLVASRVSFAVFNRADERSRCFLYLLLQGLRCFAPLCLLPATPAGVAALTALVFARWIPYSTYRWYGTRLAWPDTFALFAVYVVLVTPHILGGPGRADWPLALLIGLVFMIRARHDWRQLRRSFHWLDGR